MEQDLLIDSSPSPKHSTPAKDDELSSLNTNTNSNILNEIILNQQILSEDNKQLNRLIIQLHHTQQTLQQSVIKQNHCNRILRKKIHKKRPL